jgi:protein-tyrosine phosphatase
LDTSLALLQCQLEQGVDKIVFTPHFYYERTTLQQFAAKRSAAYQCTLEAADKHGLAVETKPGAEVYFSVALPSLDLSALAFAGTPYILIELPTTHLPSHVEDTLYEIRQQGFTPILAHVERYGYVAEDPTLLYQWVSLGALAQINAAAVLYGGTTAKQINKYIRWNLVHLIASDAHSMQRRPPNLKAGCEALPKDTAQYFLRNAQAVFSGCEPDILPAIEPRRRLGFWV